MSKYTIMKNEHSVDVIRNSDNHTHGFMCSDVFYEPDILYVDEQKDAFGNTIEADTLPSGKKFGDVKTTGRGWVQENWDLDTKLKDVFGEVDADLKKELTDYFTSDMKTKYLEHRKAT